MTIGPKNKDEARVFAEENLVADVQVALHRALEKADVSRSQLAARLGVTPARVTQLFDSNANPTLRMLARVLHALELECDVKLSGPLCLALRGRRCAP